MSSTTGYVSKNALGRYILSRRGFVFEKTCLYRYRGSRWRHSLLNAHVSLLFNSASLTKYTSGKSLTLRKNLEWVCGEFGISEGIRGIIINKKEQRAFVGEERGCGEVARETRWSKSLFMHLENNSPTRANWNKQLLQWEATGPFDILKLMFLKSSYPTARDASSSLIEWHVIRFWQPTPRNMYFCSY